MSVTVPDTWEGRAVQLVAATAGYDASKVSSGPALSLAVPGQPTVSGLNTICTYIASQATTSQLAGSTPEEQAKVHEWLERCHTALTPLKDSEISKVNDDLLTRTYLVGSSLTVADLVLYAKVSEAAVNFPIAQHFHFQNLLRWYDLIHQTADRNSLFPKADFLKPKFQAPVIAPPQPKAAAAAGADGKKGAAAAQQPAAAAEKGAAPAAEGSSASGKKGAAPVAAASEASAAAGGDAGKDKGGKKEKKEKKEDKKEKKAGGDSKKADEEARIDMLDVRVGKIVKVERHPNADALYLEQIDLGEGEPRQVISGLVRFVPQEQMENRRVLVVCNLKPAKMRDVMSYGMVLCASDDSHEKCDPVIPPEGVAIGERITVPGFDNPPLEEINPKKKILEKLFPDMKTDADGVVNYKGAPFMTTGGPVTATIKDAWVK